VYLLMSFHDKIGGQEFIEPITVHGLDRGPPLSREAVIFIIKWQQQIQSFICLSPTYRYRNTMPEKAKRFAENYTRETLRELAKGNVEYHNLESVNNNVEKVKVGIWLL
jgi:hypothetical protein